MFNVNDLQTYEVRPLTLMAYLLIDPARSGKKDSANTAMVVIGIAGIVVIFLLGIVVTVVWIFLPVVFVWLVWKGLLKI